MSFGWDPTHGCESHSYSCVGLVVGWIVKLIFVDVVDCQLHGRRGPRGRRHIRYMHACMHEHDMYIVFMMYVSTSCDMFWNE